jgi:mRNA interferase YafO
LTVQVFIAQLLQKQFPEINQIAKDFAAYKRGDALPDYFGRDGDYKRPKECVDEDVWHIHLSESTPKGMWATGKKVAVPSYTRYRSDSAAKALQTPKYTGRMVKKSIQTERTSDTCLVYCRGFSHPDRYLLIDILSPNAHEQANEIDRMLRIAQLAARFREHN